MVRFLGPYGTYLVRLCPMRSMRLNCKVFLFLSFVAALLFLFSFWTRCEGDVNKQDNNFYRDEQQQQVKHNSYEQPQQKIGGAHLNQLQKQAIPIDYEEIDCLVNEEYTITARREGSEVYIPFSFLQKYFEVYGKISEYDGYERFEWAHSYSRVYAQEGKYTPQGVFMSFEHYNVATRDRVKCISGTEGVPLSTQWGVRGYYYPIQIAQYGLSHYSKYLMEKDRTVTTFEDGEDEDVNKWHLPNRDSYAEIVYDESVKNDVMEFETSDKLSSKGITLKLGVHTEFVLGFDVNFVTNGSVTVVVEMRPTKGPFYIHYVCSNTLIEVRGNNIYYGIGEHRIGGWSKVIRDLAIDLVKGLAIKFKSKKARTKMFITKVVALQLRGSGKLDNLTLSSTAHLAQFYFAANWLVTHQDKNGGWPIMITRKLADGKLQLPPGWYSAMAQGHAMSLLIRAYIRTKNRKYLKSALQATKLFDVKSSDGGVLAKFMDKINWYEEYPTTPSSYVLNGFIYSLIGLYDLKTVVPPEHAGDATRLYETGMESLKAMLPMFDTGSGTIYDLRHLTLGVAPNLARWDYHATHINQLLLLATIDSSEIISSTAKRWSGYMKGHRAAHN